MRLRTIKRLVRPPEPVVGRSEVKTMRVQPPDEVGDAISTEPGDAPQNRIRSIRRVTGPEECPLYHLHA